MRAARSVLLLAFVLLLVAGCGGSSRRGCSVVLRAAPTNGRQITSADMQTAQQIVETRVDTLGVTSPQVTVHGDELVIGYSGTHAPTHLAKTVSVPGRLEVFDFEPSLAPPSVTANQQPTPLPSLYKLLEPVQSRADETSPRAYYLFDTRTSHSLVQGPASTVKELLSPYKRGRQPSHTVVLKVPANTEVVRCMATTSCAGAGSRGISKSGVYWYLFKSMPALTGRDLVESGVAADLDPNSGQPIVTLPFTKDGSRAFQRITEAEYNRGRVNAGEAGNLATTNQTTVAAYAGHNAFVLDGRLVETPYIDYTDPALAQGIVGNAQIVEPSTQAAKRTALILQSGSLPYTFVQVGRAGCAR